MPLSNVSSTASLFGTATHTRAGIVGSDTLGAQMTVTQLASTVGFVITATLAKVGDALLVNVPANSSSGSTAWVAGAAQIETATVVAASGCTSNGNCALVLTSGVVAGSPLTVTVPLTTAANTATLVAAALAAGLAANAAVAAKYAVTSSGADIILTRAKDANGFYQATDSTLNLAIPAGIGITAAATSAGTLAGTQTSGALVSGGDGKDFEGIATPTITAVQALDIRILNGGANAVLAATSFPIPALFVDRLASGALGSLIGGAITITATAANTQIYMTVFGTSA